MSEEPKPFSDLPAESKGGLLREFWLLLKHNKKYWMLPIIVLLLILGLLIILGGSAAAPFIYRLFRRCATGAASVSWSPGC
jgi:hypothetical protein